MFHRISTESYLLNLLFIDISFRRRRPKRPTGTAILVDTAHPTRKLHRRRTSTREFGIWVYVAVLPTHRTHFGN